MAANTFGEIFAVTTFGESHGPAIGCVIDGCPPGLPIDAEMIKRQLRRRATGRSRHTSQRREKDDVQILSGVFEGLTTGMPIALLIENTNARPRDYEKIRDQFRPGHADYSWQHKYGIRDYRGGGRASARETTMRVAAGAIARAWLEREYKIEIQGWLAQLGEIRCDRKCDFSVVEDNPFFAPDASVVEELENYMDALRKSGDSVGARVNALARNVPVGWGEPVYARLDAELAAAMMSINAAKGVEIGAGFGSVTQKGSEHRDAMRPLPGGPPGLAEFASNNAGGILAGVSTGQEILVSTAFKPTSSLRLPVAGINRQGEAVEVVTTGRHDPCVGIRAVPIVEAMLALVLMDMALRHRAYCES